jgi:DNA-binding LacI/PurR family transcriptional regulator
MATIGDVAREAGVARSTVSSVLTGRKFVNPETKARVEAAIAALDYTVNQGARALATSRSMTLGLVVRFHESEFSPALATYIIAVTDVARAHGYRTLLLTDFDGADAVRTVIRTRQVDGLVLLNVVENDVRIAPIVDAGFPAVLVGMPAEPSGIDAVDLDFSAGARMLVDHLADAGHRTATFVTWPEDVFTAGRTYAAHFRDACLEEARSRALELRVLHAPVGPEAVKDALRHMLDTEKRPTALLVHNDAAIAMLPLVLRDLGLEVPRDCSVVSLHSAELGRQFGIPYTAVESQPERVSELAVEKLVARLDSPPDAASTVLVEPPLTVRGSVAWPQGLQRNPFSPVRRTTAGAVKD